MLEARFHLSSLAILLPSRPLQWVVDRPKSFLSASAYALYAHFALQLLAGVLLAIVYRPVAAGAHASTEAMHQGAWRILQGFHYWGSAVMIVHSALHLAALTWAGWYRGPQVRSYLAALALAGLSVGFQITGNALPWDRHGVQTAAVEGAIASRVPVVGATASKVMLGGDALTDATLPIWYNAHRILLPIALLVALGLGLSAPRKKAAGWVIAAPAVAALLLAIFIASPLGTSATAADYGRFDAKPSWYTVPIHGLLVWGDRLVPGGGWIGAALIPALFGLGLLVLPLLKKPKPALARGLLLGFGGLGAVAAITSGSHFAPLVGTRDPRVRTIVANQRNQGKQDTILAAKGKELYTSQGCIGCHGSETVKGTGGPSLKDVWKEHPEADYYMRYVKKPSAVEPGSTMPAFPNLKTEELRALAEFLRFAR
ncbi:c-type cytochrome [bacterium]|nr:MAG: c-type cytochrome [bacterium]